MSSKLTESFAKKAKVRLSGLINYAVWFFILILAISIVRNIGKVKRIKEEIKAEKMRISKIEADNEALIRQVSLTQDPQFVEKEIRNKLGLVRAGEVVVVLPDPETVRRLAPKPKNTEDLLPPPTWKKWVNLFAP